MNAKAIWEIFRDAGNKWLDNKAPRLGAALAYYTAFSLAPLVLICVSVAGLIFGEQAAQGHLLNQIRGLVGEDGGAALQAMLANANKPEKGILATIIGVVLLIFGATGVFGQLQDALNTIWMVQPKPDRGVWGFIQDRFLSFSMVLGCCFLLLVSLIISTALGALSTILGDWQTSVLGQILNFAVSFGVITLLFAMIYRFLPDAVISWRHVWLGAAITSLLFGIGKWLIGLYLGQTAAASAYGAAGSLAVLLIWLYYSSQIFLFGAELTKVYADKYGNGVIPTPNAQAVTAAERAEEGIPQPSTTEHASV